MILWIAIIGFFSPAMADWTRIQIGMPSLSNPQYQIVTYAHRGKIDREIDSSEFPIFVTVAYDLSKTSPKIFSKFAETQEAAIANQFEAQEHIYTNLILNHGLRPLRGQVLTDPCIDGINIEYIAEQDMK